MASKKPRLQFTEDSGSAADSKIRKPAQPKLLTDEQKAKARKEQLRFGKKENAAPIDPNTRQGVVRKGVAKRDTLWGNGNLGQQNRHHDYGLGSCICVPMR